MLQEGMQSCFEDAEVDLTIPRWSSPVGSERCLIEAGPGDRDDLEGIREEGPGKDKAKESSKR